MEVSFYPGCTAHSTGLEYSSSLKAVFDSLGVNLLEIEDWNCCGAAAAHALNGLLGYALPARNIAIAQGLDLPLVVPCAGCFNALRRAQRLLAEEKEAGRKIEEIVGFKYNGKLQIQAMVDFMLKRIGLNKLKNHLVRPLSGLKVACYYGCALVRRPEVAGIGDHENPTFLDDLVGCLNARPVEWSYKADCCGADLALTHASIVENLVDKITGMAIEAGANCLVCSCGLCQINLEMRQTGRNGLKLPVFYFTELMGLAMDLEGKNKWWKKHLVNPEPLLGTLNLLE